MRPAIKQKDHYSDLNNIDYDRTYDAENRMTTQSMPIPLALRLQRTVRRPWPAREAQRKRHRRPWQSMVRR